MKQEDIEEIKQNQNFFYYIFVFILLVLFVLISATCLVHNEIKELPRMVCKNVTTKEMYMNETIKTDNIEILYNINCKVNIPSKNIVCYRSVTKEECEIK